MFTLAGVGFFFLLGSMMVLGLIAADLSVDLNQPILAAFEAMSQTLPTSVSLIIFVLLLMTLLSAPDSALVASASIISVDVFGEILDRDIDETGVSCYAMVAVSIAVAVAAMSPLNTLDWVLLNALIGAILTIDPGTPVHP